MVTLNDETDASDATLFRLEPLYLYNGSETVVHLEQFFRIGCVHSTPLAGVYANSARVACAANVLPSNRLSHSRQAPGHGLLDPFGKAKRAFS